jgi:ATP-independent RNA helicase DbpA
LDKIQLLKQAGYTNPNDIQKEYWAKSNSFSILLAPTGSGKTLAFLLKAHEVNLFPLLVISPTRELVLQLSEHAKKIFPTKMITSCYGGHSIENELNQLKNNPDIIIGTPGRLLDYLERKAIDFTSFQQLIIDEYDKLLELNFRNEINTFIQQANWKQIQLSSATFLNESEDILKQFNWEIVNLLTLQKPDLSYFQLVVKEEEKVEQLIDFLKKYEGKRIIVFCAHREACERIYQHLYDVRIQAAIYHGGLKQSERERAYVKFNRQSEHILVCTDLAARGLDLPQVDIVVHYQDALDEAAGVHREGRTGRNGQHGDVVYFTSDANLYNFPTAYEIKSNTNEKQQAIVTLFCNGGRKQKLRKVDFIGFLCKEMGLPSEAVTGIDIFDNHTYITMLSDWYYPIKEQIQYCKIKKERLIIRVCYS